ncbi:LuxR family transcriptional regulator [Nocardioides flavus (ex Wang et al. 2016)]|uniref:LuxR family transcriptional regulator n=1 Tax=Nocardioides flavus (ex Wang et al. 2016) TaxID=2058780 RepID=A0ABQ3HEZ2_9ACTN|nr:LuxR family transcriptional regulator [Nocardioides flavus (ex Wang et al. 2016)]GHE16126.1 LuxR family transcriptional regulator [Nocardioides flavus (ex Wang et al. 2016)]
MPLGPQERILFEERSSPLYEEIVASGGVDATDSRIVEGGELHGAFTLLVQLGLLTRSEDGLTWRAADPAAVQAQVVAPLGQQGAELIAESAHWAQAFNTLSHAWRRSPSAVGGPFTEIRGSTIRTFLDSLVADAQEELLTAQPQDRRGVKQLDEARVRTIAALDRGVKMRTLYQHAARRGTATRKYVAAVTAAGAEVRTLDEFFNRLIVVDRRVAVIPSHEGLVAAMVISEPSTVGYLIDMFERHWERARPFTSSETSLMRDIAAEQRAMTIRMLLEGRADPAGAKRLGVSPRTYAAYVADLKNEFEVETRFQLGYEMGKRGISGRETD